MLIHGVKEMESSNKKISVYLDKDIYDQFMTLCNRQNRSSYDVLRNLITKLVEYQK